MAKAVVFLFLLDSLPDFNNVINTTLHKFEPGLLGVPCDATITAPVLQVISKKLNLTEESAEKLQHIDFPSRFQSPKFQELSPETVNNVGFQDNLVQESYEFSVEKSPSFIEHIYSDEIQKKNVLSMAGNASKAEFSTEQNFNLKNNSVNASKNEVVKATATGALESNVTNEFEYQARAPFLAAIFETVGNVTAQTCGGVVLSPHWVLTAAACVNVLGSFYSNISNETTDNYYSIVAGANDPLKDGTVHQVSKIYLHPTPVSGHKKLKRWFSATVEGVSTASLALLRVEPGVKGDGIEMMGNETWYGVGTIYGWALQRNQNSFEMTAVSSPAKQLSSAECKKFQGVAENNTLCLSVNDTASNQSNNNRMTSGCPVVALQAGKATLLAVALTDGTRPLLASPLSAHRDWLLKLTREDYDTGSNKLRK